MKVTFRLKHERILSKTEFGNVHFEGTYLEGNKKAKFKHVKIWGQIKLHPEYERYRIVELKWYERPMFSKLFFSIFRFENPPKFFENLAVKNHLKYIARLEEKLKIEYHKIDFEKWGRF